MKFETRDELERKIDSLEKQLERMQDISYLTINELLQLEERINREILKRNCIDV